MAFAASSVPSGAGWQEKAELSCPSLLRTVLVATQFPSTLHAARMQNGSANDVVGGAQCCAEAV